MQLTYHQASLNLPGPPSKAMFRPRPSVSFDTVKFTRNRCYVRARIQPYYLPPDLSENTEVQRTVIKPIVKLVSADLATIDDLLPILDSLSHNAIMHGTLFYDRAPEGGAFRVYDQTNFQYYRAAERNDRLFGRVLLFKGVDESIIAPANRDLVDKAQNVGQDADKVPHVEGKTLREAFERAISIYQAADRLRKIH